MEPDLFFYSTNGTNTLGPVTEDALRKLVREHAIGPDSLICPVGGSEWTPIDLDGLRRAAPRTLRLPKYEPPPYEPTDTARQREEERVQQLKEVWNEGPLPAVFRWGCVAFASIATLLLAALQNGMQSIVVALLAGVVFVALIPYLVALPFKQAWRLRVWAVAMVIFSTLTFAGWAHFNRMHTDPTAPVPDGATSSAAGSTPADAGQPKAAAGTDGGETSRMAQAAQPVQQAMVDKVSVSDAAEKACGNFDPARLATQGDLHILRDAIKNLRATQSDVLAYFQAYDDRCRAALATGGFSASGIDRFVAAAHQSGQIDQAVAIWKLRIKLTDDHLARLDFLDQHWGSWQPKDGQLLFSDQADLDMYKALTQNLVSDIRQGTNLRNQAQAK